jgi:hypothetical protein
MAFDAKDPADKKILEEAINAALSEAKETFEIEVAGLRKNNERLKKEKEKANVPNVEEITRLEKENEEYAAKAREFEKQFKLTAKERDELKANYENESAATKRMIVENALTENLLKANVRKELMPAVKALLSGKVEVKINGDERVAVVGNKSLGDFVAEWSQGDEGKPYVAAPVNNGSGAQGGRANLGSNVKTILRSQYDANPIAYGKELASGAKLIDG